MKVLCGLNLGCRAGRRKCRGGRDGLGGGHCDCRTRRERKVGLKAALLFRTVEESFEDIVGGGRVWRGLERSSRSSMGGGFFFSE